MPSASEIAQRLRAAQRVRIRGTGTRPWGRPVEGEAEKAEELAGEIVMACLAEGGSITGEHGVGVDKKRYMAKMFDEPDLAAFQKLRCAFDPDGIANPGKVMPTPRLCGEVPGPYRQHPLERAGLAERF